MGAFLKLKQILEEKHSFALVCHVEPDGDAIGSILALGEALERRGKTVHFISKDLAPGILHYLKGGEKISHTLPEDQEVTILLDNGDFRRTGFMDELTEMKKKGMTIVNIDHHPKNDLWKFVSVNYVDPAASSTSEILYRIFTGCDFEITPSAATALLTGIFYDTGGFQHSNTTDEVLNIASDLMKKGAKLRKISENIANSRPISLFKLWGIALSRLSFREEWGLSVSVITQEDILSAGATEEDVSGLIGLLNSTPESKAALLLYETKDAKIKGSLRTDRDDVDVSKLAALFGGGGHKKASGFSVNGRIEVNGSEWKIV